MFDNPELFILRFPIILLALTVHEFAHGWIALRFGDTTARDNGRLTLNPFSHLDMFGTLMLIFSPFGWAKPVPVNGYNLKNPKRDLIFISVAGPLSNILLALVFGYSLRLMMNFYPSILYSGLTHMPTHLNTFMQLGVLINIGISFFNLIPIPPLDGSKILMGLMPNSWISGYLKNCRYLSFAFIGLLLLEWVLPNVHIFSMLMDPIFNPYNNFWLSLINLT